MPGPEAFEALLCPGCGFDLRATASDRCGECGLAFDRATLSVSGIPWAHRRHVGRARAYFKTLWLVTLDRHSLRSEAVKPQALVDALAFRRVTAFVLAMTVLGVLGVALVAGDGIKEIAILPREFTGLDRVPPRVQDAAVPWAAGATMLPVMPICLVLLAFWVTGAQQFVFRPRGGADEHRERAVAMSFYATAPLAFLLPAMALLIGPALLAERAESLKPLGFAALPSTVAGMVLFLAALFATLLRVAQWSRRACLYGGGRATLAVSEMLALWLLGAWVLLGLLPWCVGFFWVVFDSLR